MCNQENEFAEILNLIESINAQDLQKFMRTQFQRSKFKSKEDEGYEIFFSITCSCLSKSEELQSKSVIEALEQLESWVCKQNYADPEFMQKVMSMLVILHLVAIAEADKQGLLGKGRKLG